MRCCLTLLMLISLLLSTRIEAKVPLPPQNLDDLEVSLVTVPRGQVVYARYGHNILRFRNKKSGQETNFNWGIFNFDDPGFATKFYLGKLNYMMAIQSSHSLYQHYKNHEFRRMEIDKINLTNKQKRILYDRMIWNAQPENIAYQYNYFYDNCSTRIRRYLNEALGGKLESWKESKLPYGFRHHIRDNTLGVWWSYLGLDLLSNSNLDVPITKWDETFLPVQLKRHLSTLNAVNDDGSENTNQKLLSDGRVLLDLPVPHGGTNPYHVILVLFATPFILGFALIKSKASRYFFGWGSILWGFTAGIWGTILVFNWTVSGHVELHANSNLSLLWPTDWVYLFAGIQLLRRKGRSDSNFSRFMKWYSIGHILAFVVWTALYLSGFIVQNVGIVVVCFGIPALLANLYWSQITGSLSKSTKVTNV